jgi:mycothiol synthase
MAVEILPAVGARAVIEALDRAVRADSGHEALGEAVWIDLEQPGTDSAGFFAAVEGMTAGYVHVARADNLAGRGPSHWTLGVAVDPRHTSTSPTPGKEVLAALLRTAGAHVAAHGGGVLTCWRFAPDEQEDRAWRAAGFRADRELFQLRVALPLHQTAEWPAGINVRTFEPGDEDAWLAVNNAAFAGHAEQGGWTPETLARRMAEDWFDPSLFVLAIDDGEIAGFNWCKLHPATGTDPVLGEIFVIGVDPHRGRRGIGRPLAIAGLDLLALRGAGTGMLFVAGDNGKALSLYRSLGFELHRVDRAYEKTVKPR